MRKFYTVERKLKSKNQWITNNHRAKVHHPDRNDRVDRYSSRETHNREESQKHTISGTARQEQVRAL